MQGATLFFDLQKHILNEDKGEVQCREENLEISQVESQ